MENFYLVRVRKKYAQMDSWGNIVLSDYPVVITDEVKARVIADDCGGKVLTGTITGGDCE